MGESESEVDFWKPSSDRAQQQQEEEEEKRYTLIYCDPPWDYGSNDICGSIRQSPNGYETMKEEDLCSMSVGEKMAADPCALLMWATGPKMPMALRVIEAWGFTYVTVFLTWVKLTQDGITHRGVGFYTRSNCEFLLLARRGSIKALRHEHNESVSSVLYAKRREHSRKPDETIDRILSVFDENKIPNKIELFARESRPGWDAYGNETGKFDRGHVPDAPPAFEEQWDPSDPFNPAFPGLNQGPSAPVSNKPVASAKRTASIDMYFPRTEKAQRSWPLK